MSLGDLVRTLDRKGWQYHWRILRKMGIADRYHDMQFKLQMVASIRELEQDGKVLVCSRFLDCDCASSTGSRLLPATWYEVSRAMDLEYDNAEGPGSCWLASPDDRPPSDSRDYALEAFEDGHPHSVHIGSEL